jgi:ubiquinone/menaquinone biosynthesis C-methylase UbiE
MQFPNHSFDAVLTAAFFHHVENPKLVLNELLRVRKPHGRLIISDINDGGQELLTQLHRDEGRPEHPRVGWTMDKIQNWLLNRGYHSVFKHGEYEDMLII